METQILRAFRGRYDLSRLLQIGINGNRYIVLLTESVLNFPDYFKSELMETFSPKSFVSLKSFFPDYFKSELMETLCIS